MTSHITTVEEDWNRNKVEILRMITEYPNVTAQISSLQSTAKNFAAQLIDLQSTCSKSLNDSEIITKDVQYLKSLVNTNVRKC